MKKNTKNLLSPFPAAVATETVTAALVLRRHFLRIIITTCILLASSPAPNNLLPNDCDSDNDNDNTSVSFFRLTLFPTVDAFSTGAGHCESGSLTGKLSGHGENGGGSFRENFLRVRIRSGSGSGGGGGSDSVLEAAPLGWPTIINPHQAYTLTLDFTNDNFYYFFSGFLFRLSDRNGNVLDAGTMYVGSTTSNGDVQPKTYGCAPNVSALTHTNSQTKTKISVDFEYNDSSYAELLLEVTVVRERTANNWFYSAFHLQVGTISTPAPVESTPAPVSGPTPCVDRTDKWLIRNRLKNWCGWARKQDDTSKACNARDLDSDCPVTCDACPCADRKDPWKIGRRTINWCMWAKKRPDLSQACDDKRLHDDCPVTCDSCPLPTSSPSAPPPCSPDPLDFHPTIGMQVEYVGSVPTSTTAAWSYNMNVEDNFDNALYFLDQLNGIIYAHDGADSVTKVFDIATDIVPAGLTLNYPASPHAGPGQTSRVHAITKGSSSTEVVVVFSSLTLPVEYSQAHAQLPVEGMFPGYACVDPQPARDLFRLGNDVNCLTSETVYNVFYKYTVDGDGSLINPIPFFALENQMTPGHLGGGIVTLDNGNVLWGTGDCLPYGADGRFVSQLDTEHCGSILSIDPNDSSYEIVATGVRNSQQFRIVNRSQKDPSADDIDLLVFMDIGGVTAEEVNAVPLPYLLDTTSIENFGWGRSLVDGKAREGTFYVGPGVMGVLSTDPPCEDRAPYNEPGYEQPWIQFGRTATDYFYAISGFAVAYPSFDKLEMIWSEFNTGLIMGTTQPFNVENYNGPATGYKIRLYDTEGNYLENGINALVSDVLGEEAEGYFRGDPRLFHYPDGTAGVFIERTGTFYRLTEIEIS